jgi:hypothetical protein
MSRLEKLPPGRYRAKYHDGNGRQHPRTFPTRTAAKAFLQTTGADMQRGQWVDPPFVAAINLAAHSEPGLAHRGQECRADAFNLRRRNGRVHRPDRHDHTRASTRPKQILEVRKRCARRVAGQRIL